MDIIRRNTDYALRAMVNLARNWDSQIKSTRQLAQEEGISYELACKLMQKLHRAKLVKSEMGPQGGYSLGKSPKMITLFDIIDVIQGSVLINRCMLSTDQCPNYSDCQVSRKLVDLQSFIDTYLKGITLDEILRAEKKHKVGA